MCSLKITVKIKIQKNHKILKIVYYKKKNFNTVISQKFTFILWKKQRGKNSVRKIMKIELNKGSLVRGGGIFLIMVYYDIFIIKYSLKQSKLGF